MIEAGQRPEPENTNQQGQQRERHGIVLIVNKRVIFCPPKINMYTYEYIWQIHGWKFLIDVDCWCYVL